jgi:hypothetical protein
MRSVTSPRDLSIGVGLLAACLPPSNALRMSFRASKMQVIKMLLGTRFTNLKDSCETRCARTCGMQRAMYGERKAAVVLEGT